MTYANRRIAGEIIDQIRADSWVPRLEMQTKDPEEIVQIQPLPMMTDDGDDENYCLLADTRFSPPDTELIDQEGWQLLIAPFRERTQRMLKMYYMDGMTMREIGNKLDISESRVCQKMGDAIKFLKESL